MYFLVLDIFFVFPIQTGGAFKGGGSGIAHLRFCSLGGGKQVSACRGPSTPIRCHIRRLLSRVALRRGMKRVLASLK